MPRAPIKRTSTQIVDLAAGKRRHLHARHGFVCGVVVLLDGGETGGQGKEAFCCLCGRSFSHWLPNGAPLLLALLRSMGL